MANPSNAGPCRSNFMVWVCINTGIATLGRCYIILEARIAELEGQQKPPTDAGKERKPPSWVKANRPARSKGERRKRPHGFARRREEPTHRVEHATASCPDCQVPLIGGRVRGSRQVITLPRVRARVTEHVVLERACPKCRKRWAPEPDWSAITVGRQRFGHSVQSEVSVLREECRLGDTALPEVALWPVSVGELVANPTLGTKPPANGRPGRYFLYRPGRSQRVVEKVLGDEFEGVLVSDFYGAYNVYQGPHEVLDPPVA